jgi:hypothetical protein
MLTPTQRLILQAEIVNDPQGVGYAEPWAAGNDQAVMDLLNAVRANNTVNRESITPLDLLGVIDVRDFQPNNLVTQLAVQYFGAVLGLPVIPLTNADGTKNLIRQNLDRAVLSTNGSQARLDALAVKAGSRAEKLLFPGVRVTLDDVAAIRRLA